MKIIATAAPRRNVVMALFIITVALFTNIERLRAFPTRISTGTDNHQWRQRAQDNFYLPRADVVTNTCLNKIKNLTQATFNILSRGAFINCQTMEPYIANVSMSLATTFESKKSFKATTKPNVFILWVDSLSRAEFVAYMPKTTAYLRSLKYTGQASQLLHKPASFAFLNNLVVGINTPYHITKLLSGRAFRSGVEDSEWMQTELTNAGYKFLYHDCWHKVVNEEFEELYEPSVEKWKRSKMISSYKTTCLGRDILYPSYLTKMEYHDDYVCAIPPPEERKDRTHKKFLSHPFEDEVIWNKLASFWQRNEDSPKFAIASSLASHLPLHPKNTVFYDDTFTHMLQSLVKSKSTVVVVMTDHGQTSAPLREHRIPFLNIIIPPGLLNPEQAENLAWNYDKLVSIQDLRHTLRTLTLGNKGGPRASHDSLGKGLQSTRLRYNRTCKEASVPVNMCPCSVWEPLHPVPEGVITATQRVFKQELEKGNYKKCPPLQIQTATTTINYDYGGPPTIKLDFVTTLKRRFAAELVVQQEEGAEGKAGKAGEQQGQQYSVKFIHQETEYYDDEECSPDDIRPEFCSCSSM